MIRVTPRFLAALWVVALALLVSMPPAAAGDPVNLQVSNIRDTSFTVSWTTAANEIGQVKLLDGPTFNDDRGASFSSVTHYVTLSGLQTNHAYAFDVISGGSTYNNNNAHWTVKTGPTLAPPTPDLVIGRVRNPDGSPATDTIVLLTIQHGPSISAPLSMLLTAKDGGFFHVNLSDARPLGDPTSYFTYAMQGDRLTIQALGARGIGVLAVEVGDARLRTNDPSQTVVVELRGAVETPTVVLQQPTPTPIPETPSSDTSALFIGLVAAALILVGLVVIAIAFVWRR